MHDKDILQDKELEHLQEKGRLKQVDGEGASPTIGQFSFPKNLQLVLYSINVFLHKE